MKMEKPSDKFVLKDDMLTSLKCSLCESFLSVSPIYITSEDGSKMKCGRCNFKTHIVCRAICYENLAKQMKFPCINKPCEEILDWDDVKSHEKICEHRTILCMKTNCNERIKAQDYISHFKTQHEKSLYTDTMVLKNIHSAYGMGVLQKDFNAFVVLFDCDNAKFGLTVCSLVPTDKVFNLTITSPGSKMSITINEQPVKRFNERYHCYKCMQGLCKYEFHAYRHHRRNIFSKMNVKVEKDVVKKTYGNQTIYYRIDIVDEKKEEIDDFDDLVDKNMILDEASEDENDEICFEQENFLRDTLICPQCSNNLEAPIYQCVTGHILCSKCRDGAEACPTCESKIENTRNYLFEEVAASFEAISTQKPEDRPQAELKDKEIECPQPKCFEKIHLKDIADHYKEHHINNFHFNTFSIKSVYTYYNIDVLVKYGKTFILLFDFDDVNFGISICSLDDEEGLEYEITLSSADNNHSVKAIRQKLVVFDDATYCFKCALGKCKNDQHHGSHKFKRRDIFRNMVTKINRDSTRRMFNTVNMNYTVRIVDVSTLVQRDKIIRQMFECTICKDYMVPPIPQCLSGHSLCNTCASKVEKCPSCEAALTGTRNLALEEATEKAQLVCQNLFENCIYRTSLKRIAAHEAECPKKPKRLCSAESKSEASKK
ncbi:unnamed protein product [Acanthoscelides obtectus]|uniref:RING-type domain-containing protein n=2 Tax=Acanthoscelides obtectus TaxID=200917 RepID=A0A9P0JXC0_ACAOB|nr:unnamed protein product [Acanthoscelides obtectus]CAK1639051.1 Probable E3 ubiquitin-protein ligase sinah [Acanthoscelides obtectus]